jgi:hypothetical protein
MRWCRHFVPVLAHTYFFEAMPSVASAAPILFGTGTWRVASHPEAQRKSPAFADYFRRAGDCGRGAHECAEKKGWGKIINTCLLMIVEYDGALLLFIRFTIPRTRTTTTYVVELIFLELLFFLLFLVLCHNSYILDD